MFDMPYTEFAKDMVSSILQVDDYALYTDLVEDFIATGKMRVSEACDITGECMEHLLDLHRAVQLAYDLASDTKPLLSCARLNVVYSLWKMLQPSLPTRSSTGKVIPPEIPKDALYLIVAMDEGSFPPTSKAPRVGRIKVDLALTSGNAVGFEQIISYGYALKQYRFLEVHMPTLVLLCMNVITLRNGYPTIHFNDKFSDYEVHQAFDSNIYSEFRQAFTIPKDKA